ncbi:MAG: SGNH/GDSL hydrolase family protein [Alphaproteobacteria bacterium]
MRRFEKHPVFSIALVLAVAIAGLLAASETYLRLSESVDVVTAGESLARPERHIRLREWLPDTRFVFAPPEIRRLNPGGVVADEYEVNVDGNGFIEPGRVHDDADLTVVFLGGSTTESMFVTPELRFPYRAGRLLEERLGVKVNSFNAAKSGNNAMHSLHILSGKVLAMRTDVVVLMNNANDLGVLSRYGTYWNGDSDFRQLRTRERSLERSFRSLRDLVIPKTYRAIRRALRRLAGRAPTGRALAAEVAAPEAAQPGIELWADDYESALRQFVATARAWRVRPVLMTQVALTDGELRRPARDDGGDYLAGDKLARRGFTAESFANSHAYFNQIARFVARSEGALLIDLAAEGPWTDTELYDGQHFADNGSRRAAEIIAAALDDDLRGRLPAATQ